jgi:hypothetical protein
MAGFVLPNLRRVAGSGRKSRAGVSNIITGGRQHTAQTKDEVSFTSKPMPSKPDNRHFRDYPLTGHAADMPNRRE